MPAPKIIFGPSAKSAVVSKYTRSLIRGLLKTADCPSCVISSTSRTPAEQARAMYANIISLGVTSQMALYAPAGDEVINEYVRVRRTGAAPATIIAAMTAKINELDPSRVSLHCADPAALNVIDIAPSSIADPVAFLAAIQSATAQGTISRYFSPGSHDPAFHLEIPQP
jgi:hypothetical protein